MKKTYLAIALVALLATAGCQKQSSTSTTASTGLPPVPQVAINTAPSIQEYLAWFKKFEQFRQQFQTNANESMGQTLLDMAKWKMGIGSGSESDQKKRALATLQQISDGQKTLAGHFRSVVPPPTCLRLAQTYASALDNAASTSSEALAITRQGMEGTGTNAQASQDRLREMQAGSNRPEIQINSLYVSSNDELQIVLSQNKDVPAFVIRP